MDVLIERPIGPRCPKFFECQEFMLSQPVVRWRQTLNAIDMMMKDDEPSRGKLKKRDFVNAVKSAVIGDSVLIDTMRTLRGTHEAMTWRFVENSMDGRRGEIDMVVIDVSDKFARDKTCDLFEVKGNRRPEWRQAVRLRHGPFLVHLREIGLPPRFSVVLYGGDDFMDFDGVMWLNTPEFLENLPRYEEFLEERETSLMERRNHHDARMSVWIADKMPDLENRIEEYFRFRLDEEPEMTFAGWLARKNVRTPRPYVDCPDMPDAKVMGVSWSVFQSLLFMAEDSKSFYRMLEEAAQEETTLKP